MQLIDASTVDSAMTWPRLVAALLDGHRKSRPQTGDVYFAAGGNGLLTRAAWISGLGSCVKAASIFPHNGQRDPALPSVQGGVMLFDADTGSLRAVIDGAAVTRWKTAADSALGSQILSRRDARILLMVGAGSMSEPLIRAHICVRPSISRIILWNRTGRHAQSLALRLADLHASVELAADLATAVSIADIVSTATMSRDPVVRGDWLKAGTHLDLVGAYTPEMREADDTALRRARIFVDYRGSTLEHIGELTIPLASGVISRQDVLADLYDLAGDAPGRVSPTDITLYKNGGGAHLDLMTALAIVQAVSSAQG